MKKTKETIIDYINALKGYQGYVQFSHRPIDKIKDIFVDNNPKVENEQGFIYEAHFYNGKDSITIRQINSSWIVDENIDIPLTDTETFYAKDGLKVKIAQIWEAKADEFCEGMEVKSL